MPTLVFPHQLFPNHPALANGRSVLMIEDPLFFGTDERWPLNVHQQKRIFHRASMRLYAAKLERNGYDVTHAELPDKPAGTGDLLKEHLPKGSASLHLCDPCDDVLLRRLKRYAHGAHLRLEIHASPMFLSPDDWLAETLDGMKKPSMARFYEKQRKRLHLLVDEDGHPEGGKWSFDAENRKKLPKKQGVPNPPATAPNQDVQEARDWCAKRFPEGLGAAERFPWPVTRTAALQQFRQFLEERFSLFGDYEDAISTRHRILFHSVLSPALNSGLLTPKEVLNDALEYAREHDIPLNSLEGFVRQIIGWREFMRAMYLRHGVEERNGNHWGFTRSMPRSCYDGTTGIAPIDTLIQQLHEYPYCHHIERLMVLGNFFLLCRINPDDVYKWFMEFFIDAYDWVMVPNVYGMSQFADGGIFTTKPYLSGSNYIRKMSDHTKGDWCATWDGLFWSFLADHADFFRKQHRLGMLMRTWDKMDKSTKLSHRRNASTFLDSLD